VGTNADFVLPTVVDISTDGLFAVVVCDSSIRRIVISTALVTTLAGRATAGSTDGVGTNAKFSSPMDGVISNVDGSFVLITDMDNYLIRKVVVSTKVVTRVAGTGASGFPMAFGIVLSSDDSFAVISEVYGYRIRKLVLSTWAPTTVAGTSSFGHADGIGTNAVFNIPGSIQLTSDSMAYVSDQLNKTIRRVVLSSQEVSTMATVVGSSIPASPVGLAWLTIDSVLLVADFSGNGLHTMYGTYPGAPSGEPTSEPSGKPSGQPTELPSGTPTGQPTGEPSGIPSGAPSGEPTGEPSGEPTTAPTAEPTGKPTGEPTG
jgi:hypothetical protein